MRLRGFRSLKSQLMASFLILTMFVLLASLGIFYTLVLDILQKRSEDATIQLFRQAEYNIVQFRSEMEKLSLQIVLDPTVQTYLSESPELSDFYRLSLADNVSKMLLQLLNNYTYIDSIYLYHDLGQMIEIRKNRTLVTNNSRLVTDNRTFSNGSLYNAAKQNYPNLLWTGANPASEFLIYSYADTSLNDPELISAIRGIKTLNGKIQTGALVLNVNQQYFANIFGNLYSSTDSEIYITDSNGTMIADNHKTNLGKISPYYQMISSGKSYGSFTSDLGAKEQIVFYSMGNTGWMLIKEIPFEVFLKDTRIIQWSLLGLILFSLIVSFVIAFYMIKAITSPLSKLTKAMVLLEKGELGSLVSLMPNNEFHRIGQYFNRMSSSILHLVEDNKRIETEKNKQEMNALQSQINPHFLYNTLNSLKMMAQNVQADNVVEGISTLGAILKGAFKADGLLCTLAEEIEFTRHYVKIMNYRFGERVTYIEDVPQELYSYKVLRFLFQPVVENAFQYGFTEEFYTGTIKLEAHLADEKLVMTISDTGKGMSVPELEKLRRKLQERDMESVHFEKGLGLWNVCHRLRLHFKENCSLNVDSAGSHGVKITIIVPLVQ